MRYLLAVLGVVVGGAGVVLGEGDDSPGLQFLGLVVAVGALTLGVRTARLTGRWRPAPDRR